jgi:hypothetical protein
MNLISNNLQKMLARNCAEVLWQSAFVLREVTDEIYRRGEENGRENGGTIGGHFRHCLEFATCLLKGIETGQIDYNARERDQRLETDRKYAISGFTEAVNVLERFSPQPVGRLLLVKPEDVFAEEDLWCPSSVERELEFLQSHTVHHYALIAFKLRAMNFAVPPEFGVAPSTLRHWKQNSRKTN